MASLSCNGAHQSEVVNLSDDEESETTVTGCHSSLNGINSDIKPSSFASILPDGSSSSHSQNFEKFLEVSKAHMKFPEDAKIISRLKKNHEKAQDKSNETERFFETLCSKIDKLSSSSGIYKILSEGLDFLKSIQASSTDTGSQRDKVLQTRIKKLEKRLEELDKKIKEVQAREVSLEDSDEENSNFILEGRLKEKFVKVYEYLCELTNCSASEEDPKIHFNGTRYPEINKNIRRYLNKTKEFPDYPTILEIVSQTNERDELRIKDLESLAREAFEEVGKLLKKRRMDSDAETFGCYLTDDILTDDSQDPANRDPVLKEQLNHNFVINKKRADEKFEHFVKEQEKEEKEGNLEPREVDDENEEEECNENEDEEDESSISEIEEDEAIVEDKKNFSNYRFEFGGTTSSCTSEDIPHSPSVRTDSSSSAKRRRQSNGHLNIVLAKIPKQCEEIIELSD